MSKIQLELESENSVERLRRGYNNLAQGRGSKKNADKRSCFSEVKASEKYLARRNPNHCVS